MYWLKKSGPVTCVLALAGSALLAEDTTDIEYGKAGNVSLRLDAHVPDDPGPFPMALVVHGGGWSSGDGRQGIPTITESLTKANFTWFSIDYRLAPTDRWPACFADLQTAIRWVKAHAAEYKGDPRRLALVGYSAGGQLTCLAAVSAKEDTQVQAVVGFPPPTDMEADTVRRGGLSPSLQALFGRTAVDDQTRPLLREMSAINFVKPGLPPFLLIHGDADKSVPYEQSVRFQAKLKENGVPCELIVIKDAPHRITDWGKFDTSYQAHMITWLEGNLAAK